MIKIEVKHINLNRSRILQMEYLGIPKEGDLEVLGWVNIGKDRWVYEKLAYSNLSKCDNVDSQFFIYGVTTSYLLFTLNQIKNVKI